jgi:hypothetical protein
MFSNIDVEQTFADFVEEYGGVVSDRTPGKKTLNADYIFHDAKVVAELKVLKDNPFTSKEFRKSLDKKTKQWIRDGYITPTQLKRVQKLKDLPDKCWRDTEKLYVRPLKTHVEKANRQIKSTKQSEQIEDYKGLLILVSDGNYLLEPKNIRLAIGRLLEDDNRYRSINTVLYLTVNMLTQRPDEPTHSRLWTNLYRSENQANDVSTHFLDDLYDKWAEYFSKVTGIPIRKVFEVNEEGITEVDLLKDTKFVRP